MSRPLYPARDTMRVSVGVASAKMLAFLIITAVVLAPDFIVSLVGAL